MKFFRNSLPIAAVVALAGLPLAANAHAFGQQYSLPLPVTFYVLGGVAAFIVSCALLVFAGPERSIESARTTAIPKRIWNPLVVAIELVLGGALGIGIMLGLFGNQSASENVFPYLFWIGLVLIVPYVSMLVSGIWELGNPFKIIVDNVQPESQPGKRPWKHGYLPALIGYVLLIVLELFFPVFGTTPRVLAIIVLLYIAYLNIGSIRYGTKVWFEHAEFFSVFFALAGKLAPVRVGQQSVTTSSPVSRLVNEAPVTLSLLAFILFALAATAFDGFRETETMATLIIDLLKTDWFVTSFIIFLLFPVGFYALYAGALLAMKKLVRGSKSLRDYMLLFAYSLIPIAFAYHFAHYFSLMLNSLGIMISADRVWYVQLAIIVFGHAFAAYISHQVALREFPERGRALLSQLPMLVLMVFYTAFGLWVLSQPFAL